MANSDKNILITPNRNLSGQPETSFTGAGNSSISLKIPDSTTATLNFESSGTNLLSIDSNLTSGSLFSVKDASDYAVIDTDSNQKVFLNQTTEISGSGGLRLPTCTSNTIPKSEEALMIYDSTEGALKVGNTQTWVTYGTNTIIKNGLILYLDARRPDSWPGSGTTWFDVSGSGNNAIMTSVEIANDSSTNHAVFNSSSDSIALTSNLFIPRQKTLSFWIRTDRPLSDLDGWEIGFLNNNFSGNGSYFGMMFGVGQTQDLGYWGFGGENDFSITSPGTRWLELNYWVNVTLTRDYAGNIRIYKNGIQQTLSRNSNGATSLSFAMPVNTSSFFLINSIGGWPAGKTYVHLNDVLIYDRELSQLEIVQNYNAVKSYYGF
jgi:hypothetical protein